MEPLVEVVTAQELELALAVKARVIGVNNRPSTAKILLDVHGILLR
jgi:indole-3-glycerol phosphate synthase